MADPEHLANLKKGVDAWNKCREEEGGEALLFNPETGEIKVANPTALLIWQLCDGTRTKADVLRALEEEFEGVDRDVLENDLDGLTSYRSFPFLRTQAISERVKILVLTGLLDEQKPEGFDYPVLRMMDKGRAFLEQPEVEALEIRRRYAPILFIFFTSQPGSSSVIRAVLSPL